MAVEMFDYLDDIIALQATIFSSLDTFCVSSMTLPGQCRLAPLIPLIQDSNQLYDFIVRIMFRLHANLPADILTGHRERFRAVFTQLTSFYNQSKTLQYFQNLITVPVLPKTQPNFMLQSDLGNYTAPVVVMPESDTFSESDLVEENLVDTAMPPEDQQPPPVPELPARHRSPPPPDFDKLLTERDNLIRHLQSECSFIDESFHPKIDIFNGFILSELQ
jgi:huntingtin interacting protein 1